MAGLRVGYGLAAPALVSAYDKVRNHFGVGRIAQTGALAALADQGWLAHVRAEVGRARTTLAQVAQGNGLIPLPSATNFVTIDCGQDGAFARRVLNALIRNDIFVRMPFVAPQDRCIRVSAGTPANLDAFAAALPLALAEARRA
jgi:histidinol-phosphate aminotransferase